MYHSMENGTMRRLFAEAVMFYHVLPFESAMQQLLNSIPIKPHVSLTLAT